jgi:PIN domain nuclease of toxin-antitoxin system
LLDELRLDVRAHHTDAAYAAAVLHERTRRYGRGLGDRSCLAPAISLGVPALTADREWKKVKVGSLTVEHIR